jgi:hypothetical protein
MSHAVDRVAELVNASTPDAVSGVTHRLLAALLHDHCGYLAVQELLLERLQVRDRVHVTGFVTCLIGRNRNVFGPFPGALSWRNSPA